MKQWMAAPIVLLAAAGLSFGQAPEAPTLPPPQPVARPPMPSLPALAHEVGASMSDDAEYAGFGTAPPGGHDTGDPAEHWWFRAEYLYWWVRRGPTAVPLAINETPGFGAVVIGPDVAHFDPFSGGRLALGYWFDADHTWGAEVGGFFLPSQSNTVSFQSDVNGNPTIVRPIVVDGQPLLVPVSVSGLVSGGLATRATLDLTGEDAGLVWTACCGSNGRVELLAGYRHLDLHESLSIVQTSQVLADTDFAGFGPLTAGTTLLAFDQVATSNHFDGGRVGARGEVAYGPCYVRVSGDAGVGVNSEEVRAVGATHQIPGGTAEVLVAPGGVSIGAANVGQFSRTRTAFAGVLGVEGGFIVTSHVRAFVAYSLLYWTDVARPGNQLSAAGPAPPFRTSDFWAQGVSAGVEVRW